jgi:4-hydroxy-3-methylbut-2-enyl diphosphate reductase
MGQYINGKQEAGIHLVVTAEDVSQLVLANPDRVAFVTQTTLSMDDTAEVITALRHRFPGIEGPKKDDICYATQNRQDAVKELARCCDLVLVVGSPNSSNSNRLKEIAAKLGTRSHLIDGAIDICKEWLDGVERVGVTAGASAPDLLVDEVILQLEKWGAKQIEPLSGNEERVVFSLPQELM